MPDLPPAIFIMGPTAAGKTDLALALHKNLTCELISVDSALVYRGMDIGTAKPNVEVLQKAPHCLVDILDPAQAYSAAQFREDALTAMAEITAQGRIPVLVGGTMLYFKALEKGLAKLPDANLAVRAKLDAEAESLGWQALHERLKEVDPGSAARIHPNDPQRIQRALEVYALTGRTLTALHQQDLPPPLPYRVAKIIIAPTQRVLLHQRIEARFRLMLSMGFMDEVVSLRARGDLDLSLPSMRAVGYRQMWQHLDGEFDFDTMTQEAIVATRRFAKRQFTWLRAVDDVVWFDSFDENLLAKALKYLRYTLNLGK